MLVLHTERLCVTALTGGALQAWLDGDVARLQAETGAVFATPLACPPLFGQDLAHFRDRMRERPHELGWWAWLVSRRDDGRAVGVCGLGGLPDTEGTVEVGYAVYPDAEGRGYATEAARAVMAWALARPGVARVRAAVPSGNGASMSVARKLGMVPVYTREDPQVGTVTVFEACSAAASSKRAGWPERVYAALRAAGVTWLGYVPDVGHGRLVELCRADPGMRTLLLNGEGGGVEVLDGAWREGALPVLLLSSSEVAKLVNPATRVEEGGFPVVLLVTLRGEEEETLPGQAPVGRAAATLLQEVGVHVVRADIPDAVPLAVAAALERARVAESREAVLVAQRVVGAKRWDDGPR